MKIHCGMSEKTEETPKYYSEGKILETPNNLGLNIRIRDDSRKPSPNKSPLPIHNVWKKIEISGLEKVIEMTKEMKPTILQYSKAVKPNKYFEK